MIDPEMVQFLLKQLDSFSEEQLRNHLLKEGYSPEVIDDSLREAVRVRSLPPSGFFSGRMSRSNFVIGAIILFGLAVVARRFLEPGFILELTYLAASLAISVISIPRIHDLDRSAWWALMMLVPPFCFALLLGLMVRPGTQGANRFGPAPD